jgi:hypothetical protein
MILLQQWVQPLPGIPIRRLIQRERSLLDQATEQRDQPGSNRRGRTRFGSLPQNLPSEFLDSWGVYAMSRLGKSGINPHLVIIAVIS